MGILYLFYTVLFWALIDLESLSTVTFSCADNFQTILYCEIYAINIYGIV